MTTAADAIIRIRKAASGNYPAGALLLPLLMRTADGGDRLRPVVYLF
jgi:hypothetical protein